MGPFLEEIQGHFDPIFKREIPVKRKPLFGRIAEYFVGDLSVRLMVQEGKMT